MKVYVQRGNVMETDLRLWWTFCAGIHGSCTVDRECACAMKISWMNFWFPCFCVHTCVTIATSQLFFCIEQKT